MGVASPTLIRIRAAILVALSLTISVVASAHAHMKVLSAPQHPVSLTLNHRDGVIREAFARTPAGVHRLEQIESLRVLSSSVRLIRTDGCTADALLLRIELDNPKTGERQSLWITSVAEAATAWFDLTPSGPTYWDRLNTPPNVDGVFLYISPHLPGYCKLDETGGPDTLSFVYAMTITRNGPNLVATPTVYEALLPLVHLFREAQRDEVMRAAYGELHRDFERMAQGSMPSREAMDSFPWRRILTVKWGK